MNFPYQERLGMPGIIGLGLLLFCLSFYFGTIAPADAELAGLKSEEAQLLASSVRQAGDRQRTAAADIPLATQSLPPVTTAPGVLTNLNAAAEKHGVIVERASYSSTNKNGRTRLEVSLPLQASYPSLRAYLHDALALTSATSLDELHLQRSQSGAPVVEANVRLSYYFAPAS